MIFHKFILSDVEDPEIYAAGPILDWQATEHGRWVMANVIGEPKFHITPDLSTLSYTVVITGNLTPEATTYYTLKYL
jgi:hypothetical protein